jgi:hypothetical protein
MVVTDVLLKRPKALSGYAGRPGEHASRKVHAHDLSATACRDRRVFSSAYPRKKHSVTGRDVAWGEALGSLDRAPRPGGSEQIVEGGDEFMIHSGGIVPRRAEEDPRSRHCAG